MTLQGTPGESSQGAQKGPMLGGGPIHHTVGDSLQKATDSSTDPELHPPSHSSLSAFGWLTRQLQLAVAGSQCELP